MEHSFILGRRVAASLAALLAAVSLAVLWSGSALGHEQRSVGEYRFTVGFMDEPVYVGQKSGLEFSVAKGEAPVEGLESTLQAQVTFGNQTRDLPVSRVFGDPGAYRSVFFPTAAGAYTFRIFGTIEGQAVDESFTSGPNTFSEVRDLSGGQFPVQFPAHAELVAAAQAGQDASSQATLALVLGAGGLISGLVGVGLGLAARRRA